MTKFGKVLRIYRIENSIKMLDMATNLGVSSSFLSAVELGEKNVPANFVDKLAVIYNMDVQTKQVLQKAADDSCLAIKLDLKSTSASKRDLALVFARKFDTLSDDEVKNLFFCIKGDESNGSN